MAKILIVDDEPRIRELIREHLEHEGFQCEEATDGSAALAALAASGAARVKVVLARTMPKTQEGGESFVFGDLVIDTASHSVKIAGEEAPLTPKEFDLLVFLVSNKGLALSREKILQKVWNYDYYGEDRTVDTHVKMLRSHLGKYRDNIVTVWGIGYKFDPDVRPGK